MRSYLAPLSLVARVTVLGLVLMVLAGSAWAGNSGLCHSVIVSSKIVLPDGSVHGPGTLTSCAERTHSPTSTLLELSIDGHPIHMVISRTRQSDAPSEVPDPFFVFHRDRKDRLVLQGYVVPKSGDLLTYGMHPGSDHFKVTSSWVARALGNDGGEASDSSAILIAASR
jgi:hypothetical protein